MEEQLIPFY